MTAQSDQRPRVGDNGAKLRRLQSSRSSGKALPTDINQLVDEALTLANYGTHAKTPGFKVITHKRLDASAGVVALEPQEISRVMLNLFSNAFHALHRRQIESADTAYAPMLQVSTFGTPESVRIQVS